MSHQPSMEGATLNERLDVVRQRLRALEGVVRLFGISETERATGPGAGDLIATALWDIGRCEDELTWLHNLPQTVLSLPAPTDDEVEMKREAANSPRRQQTHRREARN